MVSEGSDPVLRTVLDANDRNRVLPASDGEVTANPVSLHSRDHTRRILHRCAGWHINRTGVRYV